MKKFLILLLISCSVYSQSEYPQDYFRKPLDIPIVLSGTFAELRPSHFHGGLDIKTQSKQGLRVYSAAEGYVSRIKISHFGYGKAIYVTHPNGYTSVYGHLQKFSERLEKYIKQCQYDKESFEVEVFPTSKELIIETNEVIAFSGNTGGSGGPHLHFEIRDNQERPMNPMLFGIDTKDTKAPFVSAIYAYPKDENALINGKNERVPLRLIPKTTGDYEVEKVTAYGNVGFGVSTYDKQDLAPNKNGVSNIQTFFNGNKSLEIDFKRFSFDESKHIKRLIDYEYYKSKKSRIQKLFIQKNNPLSLYKNAYDNGYVIIEDSTSSVYKIRIKDYQQNETWVTIPIEGKQETIEKKIGPDLSNKSLIYSDKPTTLSSGNITVNFYSNTLYDDTYIDFKVNSDTLHLHEDNIPLQKNFYINYDLSNYKVEDQDKIFIARLYGYYKKPSYVYTKRKGNILSAGSKVFGTFTLAMDTIAPTIKPINFQDKKWLSKYRYLKVKIVDGLSGISKYRATVNGKWILMEYDYKTKTLIHDFNDNIVKDTKNELKIIVTDNVGNSSTFEATFLENKTKLFETHPFYSSIELTFSTLSFSQSAIIRGVILDENNEPVNGVNIKASSGTGTATNENGFYELKIPFDIEVVVQFTHIKYKRIEAKFNLKNGQELEFNPVLDINVEQIATVVINTNTRQSVDGVTSISPKMIRTIKGAQPGIENILKTLPGVNISNELSTQYSVRGGNFDENLVYVNEIEVYRPFLIRSGNQEGLSFVNTDLVQNVDFSAGGFQAKYGDKLSSVLDITYRNPVDFSIRTDLSLLGGSIAAETVSKNGKFSGIAGVRYRDNSLLLNNLETEGNVEPVFADAQTFLTYRFSSKFHLNFLGNISLNKYSFQPENRQTNFGTLQDPVALLVFYDGQENDEYQTYFGAFKANYFVNDDLTLKVIASAYHTTEQEYFDIFAQYRLGEVNTNIGDENLGEVSFSEGIGGQLTHARNNLDAFIVNAEHRGDYNIDDESTIEWSVKYTHEDIRDRLVEYEVIDSAGFSIRAPNFSEPNLQPYQPFSGPLRSFENIRALNKVQIDRLQAFGQYSKRTNWGENEVFYNVGVRAHSWTVNGDGIEGSSQTVFSPRGQFAIKPDWEKDILFRVAGGLYYQPPFYRELRDSSGVVQPNVKAQKSFHIVLGNEYSFKMWDRPFKLVTEAYYKGMTDVNPYTLENVRIRYRAENNAEAYAYGLDMRLNGEFVPGTESWLSFGYLKTEENIDNRGYIARPTDQRLKFGALFQDYVPNMPDIKMYLNLVYNTGVPGGSPSYADPYDFQIRLRDYRRADLGISYEVVNPEKVYNAKWKKAFRELSIGFEIYNMFDNQNSITNTWVRDVYTKRQFAIPNYLTPRVFNLRLSARF